MIGAVTRAAADELAKIASAAKVRRFEAELRPGDIILTSHGSGVAYSDIENKLIKRVAQKAQGFLNKAMSLQLGSVGHSGIYVGNGKVIDAHPAYGVREHDLRDAIEGNDFVKAVRPVVSAKERREAVNRAKKLVGNTDYSVKEAFRAWAGMHVPDKMPVRDRRRKLEAVMCSELVQHAYRGKAVPEKHRDITVPPDFVATRATRDVAEFGSQTLQPLSLLQPRVE